MHAGQRACPKIFRLFSACPGEIRVNTHARPVPRSFAGGGPGFLIVIVRFIRHNLRAQCRMVDAATLLRILPASVFCAPGQDLGHVIAPWLGDLLDGRAGVFPAYLPDAD